MALLRNMTCNFRHPMSLRHTVANQWTITMYGEIVAKLIIAEHFFCLKPLALNLLAVFLVSAQSGEY